MFSSSSKKQKKGQGLIEYAMILALVSITVIAALTLLGPQISSVFNTISGSLGTLPGNAGGGSMVIAAQRHEMEHDSCDAGQMPVGENCYSCPSGYAISVVNHNVVCTQ